MTEVRVRRSRSLEQAKVAKQQLPAASRRLARTVRLLEALSPRQPLERQVVRLALRIGLEVAQRALPKPVALVVRATVEAARAVEHEMER
jgi:hypothetical protein